MLGQAVLHGSKDESWMTPQALFDKLNAVARFDIDLAASREASKCGPDFLGPGSGIAEDALSTGWAALAFNYGRSGLRGFLNPPYSEEARRAGVPGMAIEEWAQKAWQESIRGFEIWGLFPYATQTAWWREYVEGHAGLTGWSGHAAMEVWRLPHRVNFEPTPEMLERFQREFDEGKRKSPKPSSAGHNVAVIVWRPNPGFVGPWQPAVRYWSYR
ncbi:MAG: DNA N-6-adenine-methyltransferase [Vicinamibacterales bacterium]